MRPTLIIAVALGAVVSAWAFDGMTPELATHLETLAPGELARVNVIMAERYDPSRMTSVTAGLTRAERRAVVVGELKGYADRTQRDVLALLADAGRVGRARDVRVMWLVNGINTWVDADTAYRLAARADVASVDWDEEIPLEQVLEAEVAAAGASRDEIAWGVAKVRAPDVWATGYRGEGVTVCVFDTGCNYNHLDLRDHMWDGGSEYPKHGWNFADNNNETMDYNGHGTHVCGTVASDGTAGTQAGVAPEATIMICKISGVESTVWQAWQFALEQGADLGTLSFGWRRYHNPDYATWRYGSEMQLAAGFIQFKSAGNYRSTIHSTDPLPWNVSAPGNCPPPWLHPDQELEGGLASMMAVGATTQDDVYAYFSSAGPSSWETIDPWRDYPYESGEMGLLKPDVAAPGYQIKSCLHNDNSGYTSKSGTSMAAPHAAGCAALLLDIDDELAPAELSEVLQMTALDLGPEGKDNDYGAGRLDVYEAARSLFTPVELRYFRAQGRPGAVLLAWDYEEGASSGTFNLYRERTDGVKEILNAAPVSGRPPLRFLDGSAQEGVTHRYWLEYVLLAGASRTFGPAEGRAGAKVASFAFAAPRPNPARERVTFYFSIPYDDRRAELAVYDIAGRRVATVVRGARAGANVAAWSLVDARGRPVPPGVYVCRLTSTAGSAARRVAVVR